MEIPKSAYPFNIISKPIGPLCNLHCDYCFYLSKEELFPGENRSDFIMSPEIREKFVKQYIQSQPEGTKEVVFGWQGGEPTLLPIDFYEDILRLQNKYNTKGLEIRNSLQTNGTLITDDMARFFKDHDFLIGVSIDGPEALHDRYRKDSAGHGSFRNVMAGIEKLKKHNVEFNTLTVVQDDNSMHPVEVYDFLKSIGSTYLQFIPIVEPDDSSSANIVGSRTVHPLQWGKFLTEVFKKWIASDIGEIFVQHFDLTLGQYLGQSSYLCVHSRYCGKAMAIEHNGDIYSCDHFVSPEYYLGNIAQPLAEIVNTEKQVRFGKDKFEALPSECLSCPFLQLCYGGCPKNRLVQKTGGMQNWLCEGYRYYYEKTYPVYTAMALSLQAGGIASQYRNFLQLPPSYTQDLTRNDPCPCLSGKKYKHCHGR